MLLFVPATKQVLPSIVNIKKTNKNKYNIKTLQDPCTRAKLQESLSSCLVDHSTAETVVDQQQDALKSVIHKSCTEIIGHITCKHQDWFDIVEIQDLLDCKRNTFCIFQNDNISRQKQKNTNASKLRLKRRSEILKTNGGNRKPKWFIALLIRMTCTTSSKQQRLSMSRAHITTFLSNPRMGHIWRMTLPFNNDGESTSSCSWTEKPTN